MESLTPITLFVAFDIDFDASLTTFPSSCRNIFKRGSEPGTVLISVLRNSGLDLEEKWDAIQVLFDSKMIWCWTYLAYATTPAPAANGARMTKYFPTPASWISWLFMWMRLVWPQRDTNRDTCDKMIQQSHENSVIITNFRYCLILCNGRDVLWYWNLFVCFGLKFHFSRSFNFCE